MPPTQFSSQRQSLDRHHSFQQHLSFEIEACNRTCLPFPFRLLSLLTSATCIANILHLGSNTLGRIHSVLDRVSQQYFDSVLTPTHVVFKLLTSSVGLGRARRVTEQNNLLPKILGITKRLKRLTAISIILLQSLVRP